MATALFATEAGPSTDSVLCRMALSPEFESLHLREIRRCRIPINDKLPPLYAILEKTPTPKGEEGARIRILLEAADTAVLHQDVLVRVSDTRQVVLRTDDINFDGYRDLIVSNALCYESRFCSETDHFWLYEPASAHFVYHEELSHLPGLAWDAGARLLKSTAIDFDQDGLETDTQWTYQWQKGALVMIEEAVTRWDIAQGQRVRTRHQKAKMIP